MKRQYTDQTGRPYEWTERVRVAQAHKHEPWRDVLRETFALLCIVFVLIALTAVEPVR